MNYKQWIFDDVTPLYIQISNHLKYEILSGRICPGEILPSIRDMAKILQVNPNTIARVYRVLKSDKLIDSVRTNRFLVTQDTMHIDVQKEKVINEICALFLSSMESMGYSTSQVRRILEQCSSKI